MKDMNVIGYRGNPDIATVFLADFDGRLAEFVLSRQPPLGWEQKCVLILSVSFGCPINCAICDAGGNFAGHLSAEQMFQQARYMVKCRFGDGTVPAEKFKIQFARMGEPALNNEVIDAMEMIESYFNAPGLMFCVSTIAPKKRDAFFWQIARVKERFGGRFQLQFSVHSTDEAERDVLMPMPKWSLDEIAQYGIRFWKRTDRKITLNFAVAQGYSISPEKIAEIFPSELFLIKFTPVNPTERAATKEIKSAFTEEPDERTESIMQELSEFGFDVILSVGEIEENFIGSNCGQLVAQFSKQKSKILQREYGGRYRLVNAGGQL